MSIFTPFQLGCLTFENRIVMAPMTRCRAAGNLANPLMAEYYAQRAGAGLIVSEGTSPSANGLGYTRIPGLFSPEQGAGWRLVTDAVHAAGGRIFVQLMHCGRVGHPANLPAGAALLAPSAVPLSGTIWTDGSGHQPYGTPRAMTADEVHAALAEYVAAARLAVEAGFDGVELHAANGYLLNQFLDPGSNRRSDGYGGDSARRNRFPLEVAAAVAGAIGRERVGMRLSPGNNFNDMSDYPELHAQYAALARGIGELELVYVHLVDHSSMGAPQPAPTTVAAICREFRGAGGGAVILSGGYDRARADAAVRSGAADLVAFGRPFIANPDLVERLRRNAPLNDADQKTFYSAGAEGYVDYPSLEK